MNIYLIVVLAILSGDYLLSLVVETLNLQAAKADLPAEFNGWYNPAAYRRSQNYLKENTLFKLVKSTLFTALIIFLILSGGFNFIDQVARGFKLGVIPTGLIFAGMIFFGFQVIDIPFTAYRVFGIEEKYGFNRTSPRVFIQDVVKKWFLTAVIGGGVFAVVVGLFILLGRTAWFWCWLAVSLLELFMLFIAPVVIMPLFNKFTPLEPGELKEAIQEYADSQNFKVKGIFKMDGSRRSAKANAFFSGFGRFKRIVLFDTLIQKHTADELVAILAHEVGHYQKRHILKFMAVSILANGVMFFILSFFIGNPDLFAAFRMREVSVYAGLLFFSFLYAPINLVFSILLNFISRKNEEQADNFAVTTFRHPESFIAALKKLSVGHLASLTPHPWKVFLAYSHPPVLTRIQAIQALKAL